MAIKSKIQLKSAFQTGDIPTQSDFEDLIDSYRDTGAITKADVGLGNVLDVPQLPASAKGTANGVAELDATGKVPSTQLPAYVDDVLEFANIAAFPVTGTSGLVYVDKNTNLTYRWSGSAYVAIGGGVALGENAATAYRGDRGKTAYDHSQVTHDKVLVGLGNVNNTSDVNKPVSTAQQIAIDALKVVSEDLADSNTVVFTKQVGWITTNANKSITSIAGIPAGQVALLIVYGSGTLSFSGLANLLEAGALTKKGNFYIVKIFNASQTATPNYVVSDYMGGGNTLDTSGMLPDVLYGFRNGGLVPIPGDTAPDAPSITTSIVGDDISIAIIAGAYNGGQVVTGWHIQTSADGLTDWANVTANTGNTTTPYVVTTPATGFHYYRVASINSVGESAWSNVDGETIEAPSTIILYDPFTGANGDQINTTTNWDLTNPTSSEIIPSIQDNQLKVDFPLGGTTTPVIDFMTSKASTDGACSVSCNFVSINGASGSKMSRCGIFVDNDNHVVFSRNTATGEIEFKIRQSAVNRISVQTTGIDSFPGKWAVSIDGSNRIRFYQDIAGTWTEFDSASTKIWDIGTGRKGYMMWYAAGAGIGYHLLDDFKFDSTEIPA